MVDMLLIEMLGGMGTLHSGVRGVVIVSLTQSRPGDEVASAAAAGGRVPLPPSLLDPDRRQLRLVHLG